MTCSVRPMLVTVPVHDGCAVPAHSFEFAAMPQVCNDGINSGFSRADGGSGHGVYEFPGKALEEPAGTYSFLMCDTGMRPNQLEWGVGKE